MHFRPDDIAWHTETGRRKINEDYCAFQVAPDGSASLLIVADGMGGHACGEVASRMVVDVLLREFTQAGFAESGRRLGEVLQSAHREIRAAGEAEPEKAGMGSTVVAALLREQDGVQNALVAHVGDSRALQFRGDNARRLTRDHLFVVDALGVDEASAKDHAQGHVLSQALGFEGEVEPTLNFFDLEPGDSLVLCTDGVSQHVPEPLMIQALASPTLPEAAAEIVRLALLHGSRDNCTVALITVPGGSKPGGSNGSQSPQEAPAST